MIQISKHTGCPTKPAPHGCCLISLATNMLESCDTKIVQCLNILRSTMPCIASDSKEPDLACTMTAIGNPSIRRVPVPCFYSSTSRSVVK